MSTLGGHPAICMSGELLSFTTIGPTCTREKGLFDTAKRANPQYTPRTCRYISNARAVRETGADPVYMHDWSLEQYLDNLQHLHPEVVCCSCGSSSSTQVSGFKLFSQHVRWHEAQNASLDVYRIMEVTNTSLILFRRNALSAYISERVAVKSGIDHCGVGCNVSSFKSAKVYVDVEHMLRKIGDRRREHNIVDKRLEQYPNLRILRLTYETFSMKPKWCRVLAFIGLPCDYVSNMHSKLQKKGPESVALRIHNVVEVRRALCGAGLTDLVATLDGAGKAGDNKVKC